MSDLQILIQEVAKVALDHGNLHLGDRTLVELISAELGVPVEELDQVSAYLERALRN
jgi:hypothetical protein